MFAFNSDANRLQCVNTIGNAANGCVSNYVPKKKHRASCLIIQLKPMDLWWFPNFETPNDVYNLLWLHPYSAKLPLGWYLPISLFPPRFTENPPVTPWIPPLSGASCGAARLLRKSPQTRQRVTSATAKSSRQKSPPKILPPKKKNATFISHLFICGTLTCLSNRLGGTRILRR